MSAQKPAETTSIWGRLFTIVHDDPNLSAETWLRIQPCKTYTVFGKGWLITQPSSTIWVYLLGVLTTLLGVFFMVTCDQQLSRSLWGVSLILWGVGALIAGTSYQAFGYQLKCAERPKVAWTSWWEVIYLIFQQVSVNVMLVAVAYSCLSDVGIKLAIVAAVLLSISYIVIVFFGALKPIKSLISFELMVHFCTPFIILLTALNAWRYWQLGDALDLALLGTWLGLYITMWLYWQYYLSGLTQKLWAKGRWFSENDVLHVALIIWVAYIAIVVAPLIKDIA